MKKLLIALALLAALAAGGAFWAWHSLDVIVKAAIEYFGPDVTGSSVKVGSVTLSTADGRGNIKGLEIGNPRGYSAPHAARLGEVRLSVDPHTLRDPVVTIREIAVESAQIAYEKAGSITNLEALQKNIEAYVARGKRDGTGEGAREAPKGTRYVIERLVIRHARVTMTNPGLKGQGITFTLPDIEMRDIGKHSGGVTAAQAAALVTATVVTHIAQRVLTNIDLLKRGGTEGVRDALRGILK